MYIKKLSLKKFRNIEHLSLEPSSRLNIFFGDNAQGKTNLLEAIYVAALGRSQRTYYDRELIMFNSEESHIQLLIRDDFLDETIHLQLKRDGKKGIAINNQPIKKLGELLGILPVVIFSPEDLSLIKGAPSVRRRFMDIELCQISNLYYYDLQQYYKVLNQRNKLLKNMRSHPKDAETLFVWDSQLVEYGTKIIKRRQEFISQINEIATELHAKITQFKEKLSIFYKQSVEISDFANKLEKSYQKDIFSGSTSYGIHKDDLIFYINDSNARTFGSQGQQRTASLSTKLAEIQIIKLQRHTNPVLLLDDVLSELDFSRQIFLLKSINDVQTFITCTGVEDFIKNATKEAKIYEIRSGKLRIVN